MRGVTNQLTQVRNERLQFLQKLSDEHMLTQYQKTNDLELAFGETMAFIKKTIRRYFAVSINCLKDYLETVVNHSYRKIANGELLPPLTI